EALGYGREAGCLGLGRLAQALPVAADVLLALGPLALALFRLGDRPVPVGLPQEQVLRGGIGLRAKRHRSEVLPAAFAHLNGGRSDVPPECRGGTGVVGLVVDEGALVLVGVLAEGVAQDDRGPSRAAELNLVGVSVPRVDAVASVRVQRAQ